MSVALLFFLNACTVALISNPGFCKSSNMQVAGEAAASASNSVIFRADLMSTPSARAVPAIRLIKSRSSDNSNPVEGMLFPIQIQRVKPPFAVQFSEMLDRLAHALFERSARHGAQFALQSAVIQIIGNGDLPF